jgi:hypothetical protein
MPKSKPRSLPKEQFITFQQAAKTPPAHTHVSTITTPPARSKMRFMRSSILTGGT